MRIPVLGLACTALLASSAVAQPLNPPSEDATGVVLRSTVGEFSGRTGGAAEPVAEVRPGQTMTITGECVRAPSTESLRVVLTIADGTTGYRAVLATDQRFRDGNLQVRVPDMPQSDNQVFQVRVFRLGEQTPQICEAGAIRIDAQPDKVG